MARTKPHSVRFEEDDYDFICKREQLKSAQSILDFFVSNYMKLYRVEKKSIFSVSTTDSFEGSKVDLKKQDEEVQWQGKRVNYFYTPPIEKVMTPIQSYIEELNECRNYDEIKKTMLYIKNDQSLQNKDKLTLNSVAATVIEEKGIVQY